MHFMRLFACGVALWATGLMAVAQPAPCHCPDNLQQLVASTEANYAGYPTKVNARTRPAYQALLSSLRAKAARADGARACFFVLKEYIRFFYDKHFNL
ncbi:MAG: hypothetical protein MUF62_05150, partial [Chitinophagaceae bacterium]|nr:hypothetical protein [Chitinophagaceae bacterium]